MKRTEQTPTFLERELSTGKDEKALAIFHKPKRQSISKHVRVRQMLWISTGKRWITSTM
jgi:hypothetical protein